MEEDGFQIVRRNRGKRRPKQTVVSSDALTRSATFCSEDTHVDLENLKRKIRLFWNEFAGSEFFAALTKSLDQAVQAATHKDSDTPQDSLSLSLCDMTADMNSGPNRSEELPSVEPTTVKTPPGREDTEQAPVEARRHTDEEDCALSLVVYGLGNFASCLIARYQLALVLALRQHLQIAPGGCETYDPKYTEAEKDTLADLGFTVIDNNEEGKRGLRGATVVVMPHCGKALFNNLLWANWSPAQLQRLVLLGNSFSAMLDSIPRRLWQKHIGYIAKLEGHVREVRVENCFTHTDIFNDLSVHWFPVSLLGQLPPSTWSGAEEPSYDALDVEITLRSQSQA